MKTTAFLSLFAGALFLAGCENAPDTVQEGLGIPVPVHMRVFSADQKATYDAALASLSQMGYRYVRGGPAQGELEAISGISIGDSMTSSEQFRLKARFEPGEGGGTEVSVKMTEIIQEDSEHDLGRATETPLEDTPLYEVFFRGIQQELAAPHGVKMPEGGT
jgi:hypothetical protein